MSEIILEKQPLNSDEQFYKKLYIDHPAAQLDMAQTLKAIQEACPQAAMHIDPGLSRQPADDLSEQEFPQYVDVAIQRHLRYAPAFLHSHSFFEILCVFSGSCTNILESDTLAMKAGEICIIAPGTVHAVSAFNDDSVIYNLLVRSGTFEQTFLNTLPHEGILYSFFSKALFAPGSEAYLYFKSGPDPFLNSIFSQILKEYEAQKSYFSSFINALLTTFFIQLLRDHEKDVIVPNPSGHKQEENMIFILKYMELHAETITLKELADFFNYSERQMARILKDYTGLTFSLIQNTRMAKACQALRRPDIPVSEIIRSAGYSNASHFYDVFRKIYKMTPAQYRKQYLQETRIV